MSKLCIERTEVSGGIRMSLRQHEWRVLDVKNFTSGSQTVQFYCIWCKKIENH